MNGPWLGSGWGGFFGRGTTQGVQETKQTREEVKPSPLDLLNRILSRFRQNEDGEVELV